MNRTKTSIPRTTQREIVDPKGQINSSRIGTAQFCKLLNQLISTGNQHPFIARYSRRFESIIPWSSKLCVSPKISHRRQAVLLIEIFGRQYASSIPHYSHIISLSDIMMLMENQNPLGPLGIPRTLGIRFVSITESSFGPVVH